MLEGDFQEIKNLKKFLDRFFNPNLQIKNHHIIIASSTGYFRIVNCVLPLINSLNIFKSLTIIFIQDTFPNSKQRFKFSLKPNSLSQSIPVTCYLLSFSCFIFNLVPLPSITTNKILIGTKHDILCVSFHNFSFLCFYSTIPPQLYFKLRQTRLLLNAIGFERIVKKKTQKNCVSKRIKAKKI